MPLPAAPAAAVGDSLRRRAARLTVANWAVSQVSARDSEPPPLPLPLPPDIAARPARASTEGRVPRGEDAGSLGELLDTADVGLPLRTGLLVGEAKMFSTSAPLASCTVMAS